MTLKIRKLYIDPEVADFPETIDICERINVPVEYTDEPDHIYRFIRSHDDPESAGKRALLLTRNKGNFLKPCPGTSHYTCCGYHILHVGSYCTMDCSYCILQAYFHPPLLTFFVNVKDMKKELLPYLASENIYRIGTGEFTDSLMWETIYPVAPALVGMFAGRKRAVLELKTKTTSVGSLLGLNHQGNTIMAWSLNTTRVIREQERGTAALDERIRAASVCQSHGYPLAFHFDPMIWYPGCEADYGDVVDTLFSKIDPAGIVWISLGSFRFMPQLGEVIERRFPRSRIVHGEFIKGMDGKMRYFKPLRIGLYKAIVSRIKGFAPDVTVYFCMEDDDTWDRVLGYKPSEYGGLPAILDKCAIRHCGLSAA